MFLPIHPLLTNAERTERRLRTRNALARHAASRICCEYTALRLLFAGSYSNSAGQVPEAFGRLSGVCLVGGHKADRVSFPCLYMTRLVLHFLGSEISSASTIT
jgi:hypothetical protein